MIDRAAWARMAADIGPSVRVRRARKLGGGLMSDVFAVELEGAAVDRAVVKRFRADDPSARVERDCLEFARRIALATPEPLALDAEGHWFGVPAIVMTQVPGRAEAQPRDVDDWLRQIATAMATIHDTATGGASGSLVRDPEPTTWSPPDGMGSSPLVERAVAALEAALPRDGWPRVLTHGDFHPCQTLWLRSTLSGVVDWGDLHLGPRWYEVAYCRTDVVLLYGMQGADRLLEHYVEITGLEPVDLPAFDLVCGLNARQWGHRFLVAYQAVGRTDTVRQFAARLAPFNRRALAQLGG